jgi:multidrug efflux pump
MSWRHASPSSSKSVLPASKAFEFIASTSEDGLSAVTVEFDTGRDVDGAVNDVRDRVSAILGDLPDEADPPEIQKVDSNNDVIMWLNLVSDRMTVPALTDYADRYLVTGFRYWTVSRG